MGLGAQAPAPAPAFETASVKPSSGAPARTLLSPEGRFIAINQPVRALIQFAHGLRDFELTGPEWIGTERFDIDARAGQPPMPAELQLMIRSLLVERFKLVVHTETRQVPMLELRAASADGRMGRQIRPADPAACSRPGGAQPVTPGRPNQLQTCASIARNARMTGRSVTMDQIAASLSNQLAQPVVNRTRIAGVFDFDLDIPAAPGGGSSGNNPSALTAALQEQVGLSLNSTTGPLNVVVVDNVGRPTPD